MDEMEVVVRRCGEKDASRVPSRHAVVCSRCELELEAGQATGNMYNTSLRQTGTSSGRIFLQQQHWHSCPIL